MHLKITLLSDTAFGRGNGMAGIVNNEVEHDASTGLPIIKGRTIKGLIVEACADILFSLSMCNPEAHDFFAPIAANLFGEPGSDLLTSGLLHFHNATLPLDFVQYVRRGQYTPNQVLEIFTTVRRQTAVDSGRDAPLDQTLRATRVVIRDTIFHAPISTSYLLDYAHQALLVACAGTVHHAGLNRTRGLGHLQLRLEEAEKMTHEDGLAFFESCIRGDAK